MKKLFGNLMNGRYGTDQYNIFLVVFAVIIMLIGIFCKNVAGTIVMFIALGLIIYSYVRLMSKNTEKRREENRKYLKYRNSFVGSIKIFFRRFREGKEFKFFKCPDCAAVLRLPRHKGTIEITCPVCGKKFIKKT